MRSAIRSITVGLVLVALVVGGVGSQLASAQPPGIGGEGERPGTPGSMQSMQVFFRAMFSGDLLLLKDGGALSGTLAGDEFQLTPESGEAATYARDQIAMISLGESADQVVLTSGETVSGQFGNGRLTIALPNGTDATINRDQLSTIVLQLTPPGRPGPPEAGSEPEPPSPEERQAFFGIMRSLQSQNLFAVFAKAMTTYDTVLFSNGQVLSGQIANASFTFDSPTFGTFTMPKENVSQIELAESADDANGDAITLKTGDRVTGTLAADSLPQFQPASIVSADGQTSPTTLERGQVNRVIFRLPASAFGGGGRGPGIGGGPGN